VYLPSGERGRIDYELVFRGVLIFLNTLKYTIPGRFPCFNDYGKLLLVHDFSSRLKYSEKTFD
jgi:hypothetical protein